MRSFHWLMMFASAFGLTAPATAKDQVTLLESGPEFWRSEHRIIDLHQHIAYSTQNLARAIKIMDAVGVGIAVDLTTGTVAPSKDGGPSQFERNKSMADTLCPGRFVHYMNLDYAEWDAPDFSQRAVQQVEQGHRLGAAGLKEYKRLGLYLKDSGGNLLKIDDVKLDPVWKRCGGLGMPVSIHIADPKAFWLPYDEKNERWQELKDHKAWWFGDTNKFPPWKSLLDALNRVIARHPKTTFVCVHFGNNAEELSWVDASLTRYPNMMVDLAARIPEIGRHAPSDIQKLFLKHQDRIFFATDFQVLNRLILGSSGNEPPPTDADAEAFFAKEWRWLETNDRDWPHMTPIQGNWTINSIGLPLSVLRKIYFDNARKLLARALPSPILRARHTARDFAPEAAFDEPIWRTTRPVRLEYQSRDAVASPAASTEVRALWSGPFLYLRYDCPFRTLTVFEPVETSRKRFDLHRDGVSLWDRDVVEVFVASEPGAVGRYAEFEVAPTNERLDLMVHQPEKAFTWESGFQSATHVDKKKNVWTCIMRIPTKTLGSNAPVTGVRWRINLFRCDRANKAFLAWNPTLQNTFHVPERFGILEFVE